MSGFRTYKLDGLPCPRCGQATVTCEYWDSGHLDWYDNFRHTCHNPGCSYEEVELDQYGGQANFTETDWPNCPFCSRSAVDPARVRP